MDQVVAASQLPIQMPFQTKSIYGSFYRICLQYLASKACRSQHFWHMAVYQENNLMFQVVLHSQQVGIVISYCIMKEYDYKLLFQQFQQYQMDNFDTSLNRITIKDIGQNQYKLYDVQLFKSQLKIFKKQPTKQELDTNKKQDQSLNQDEFFPITHQDAKQEHNIFSINHSFEMSLEESSLPQKKNTVNDIKQADKPTEDEQMVVQTWKNRPRRTSNPMFLQNKNEQSNQLVKQLEILSKQRSKYRQTTYFSKKQRSVQVKSIEDLFQNYKTNQNPQPSKSPIINTPRSNTLDEFLIPKSPLSIPPSPLSIKQYEKGRQEKQCQLCELTKEKVQKLKFFKSNNNKLLTPQLNKSNLQIQIQRIGTQPKIKNINFSPSKSPANKYLVTEDKNKFKSEHSKQVFKNQVPLKQEYLQQNRLRDQYLKNAKMRSESIHKEIQKLKYPSALEKKVSSSRKSIFDSRKNICTIVSPKTIKSQLPNKSIIQPKTPQHTTENKSPYKNIFSSNIQKNRKNENQSVDFKYVRESLVNTRIHIFNTKSRQKDMKQSQQKSKSNSKRKISIFTRKSPKKHSPLKNQILFNFNLMQMDFQTRKWFQKNQQQIILQAEKIHSYELINRYISKGQIELRLSQFIKGMIEPKRWILLMVDSVYARLKDRYLPN